MRRKKWRKKRKSRFAKEVQQAARVRLWNSGKIPRCFSMTTRLSVLASWNDVTGGRCISFGGNYVACRAVENKTLARGKNPFPEYGKYGKMLRCYIRAARTRGCSLVWKKRSSAFEPLCPIESQNEPWWGIQGISLTRNEQHSCSAVMITRALFIPSKLT